MADTGQPNTRDERTGTAIRAGADTGSTVLTLKEAAKYLRVSKAHLSNVIRGKVAGVPPLPHAMVGRRILIKRSWADRWLEQVGAAARPE